MSAIPRPAPHRALLHKLQERQRACRNIDGGYWIVEADPAAAHHAIIVTPSPNDLSWAALATDGITNRLTHLGRTHWATVASKSDDQLADLLADTDRGSATTTPPVRTSHAPSATTTKPSRSSRPSGHSLRHPHAAVMVHDRLKATAAQVGAYPGSHGPASATTMTPPHRPPTAWCTR